MNWYYGTLAFFATMAVCKYSFELANIYNLLRRREKDLDFLSRASTGDSSNA